MFISAISAQVISESRKALNYTTNLSASTIRKEIRQLSNNELSAYFSALWTYKNSGRQDGKSYFKTYDHLVAHHATASVNTTADQAHQYASFMIWHSVYVKELEIALQSIDPTVAVPYWDWTLDTSTGSKSVIFTSAYFGSSTSAANNYAVTDSLMAYWPIVSTPLEYISWSSPGGYLRGPNNANPSPYVTRYVGGNSADYPKLPTTAEYTSCLSKTEFDDFWSCVWGVSGALNGQTNIHAGVHVFTGGSWTSNKQDVMGDIKDPITSPNDPLWFSHHAQLERLYYTWRQSTGDKLATTSDPCGIFYGKNAVNPQPSGHNLNDVFYPYFYLGGDTPITLSQACSYLNTQSLDYTYL
eukprot:gene18469-24179_t